MPFPTLTSLTDLPTSTELQHMSDWETNDKANLCISFWQYAQVLLEPDVARALTPRVRKILKILYFKSSPLTVDELTNILHENDNIVVSGTAGLGGFGKKLFGKIKNNSLSLPKEFPQPHDNNDNAYLQVFLDLIRAKKGGYIHFYLKSRFRAALAQCFGDDEILSW